VVVKTWVVNSVSGHCFVTAFSPASDIVSNYLAHSLLANGDVVVNSVSDIAPGHAPDPVDSPTVCKERLEPSSSQHTRLVFLSECNSHILTVQRTQFTILLHPYYRHLWVYELS
jgi:hypothetical protein